MHLFFRLSIIFFMLPLMIWGRPGYFEPWGKDADLRSSAPAEECTTAKSSPLVKMAAHVIHFHQTVLSPVDGPRSHFRPSSSGYMLEAMQKHGFFKGFAMGCDRLMRENSDDWYYKKIEVDGKLYKYDPVPPK
jgi:putative component of membrane protein insertase Oxa1/YidC/SpoIIIJ protein YidD